MSDLLAILRASRWGRWAGLALIILAVVGLGWGGWMLWSTRAESHGAVALAQARFLVAQAQTPNAGPEAKERAQKALEDVVAEYPRLSSGAQAAYQLGNLRFAAGQYPQARAAFQVARSRARSESLASLASLGIAFTFEAEKNYEAAEKGFAETVKGASPKDFLYEEAMSDMARVQELGGKRAAALETYQKILKELPDGRRAEELRARVATLQSPVKP
jgi:predicted negative regulator of RcsB-dependent stress response